MADVFISYKNTPERRRLVSRLALVLRCHEVSVWWDTSLEGGRPFDSEIAREIESAKLVAPLWCAQSVYSEWVLKEARLGREKLFPAKLQEVSPPSEFSDIHALDLTGWDGLARSGKVLRFIHGVRNTLNRESRQFPDMLDELLHLVPLEPLPGDDRAINLILNGLREAWLRQDVGLGIQEALDLKMESPIGDLLEGESSEDLCDSLYKFSLENYDLSQALRAGGDDDDISIEPEDFDDLHSIGQLVTLILERGAREAK